MRNKTFRGGIHPNEHKSMTAGKSIRICQCGTEMVYFLNAHIGKSAVAAVKKGEAVTVGQVIAKAGGFVSANVVSSCSGTVKAVESRPGADGVMRPCIVINNDGLYTKAPGVGEATDLASATDAEIRDKVAAAGIVGMGGAGFPTHVKLAPPAPEKIDTVIANGCECEPYITCDDLLMRDKADEIVKGLDVLLRLFPNAKGIAAIEDNKPEAIAAMKAAAAGNERIQVMALKTSYPQGGERNLIAAVTGRKLPAGKLPAEFGCVVENVATLTAIYRAVCLNEPLTERYVTVSGDAVAEPGNFLVKIGTPITEVIAAAGGFAQEPKKILMGGPMMGLAVSNPEAPIGRNNNALTCMTADPVEEAFHAMTNCVRCGKCIQVCPEGLVPQKMAVAVQRGDFETFEKIHGMQCVTCGCCTYICPAKRPLTQLFMQGKAAVQAGRRAKEAKK